MTEKATAGWYEDPSDEELMRYWDGDNWLNRVEVVHRPRPRQASGWSPDTYLTTGFMLLFVAGVLVAGVADSPLDLDAIGPTTALVAFLSALGSFWFSIGIVAKGVQVGRRHN